MDCQVVRLRSEKPVKRLLHYSMKKPMRARLSSSSGHGGNVQDCRERQKLKWAGPVECDGLKNLRNLLQSEMTASFQFSLEVLFSERSNKIFRRKK